VKDLPPDLRDASAGANLSMTTNELPGASGDVPRSADSSQIGASMAAAGEVRAPGAAGGWEAILRSEVGKLLRDGSPEVMDLMTRRFEAAVIREALDFTRGRKVEAAERLGIGRNTITRKIQELDLEP